jgi:DNA-binding response OmpR family regulator
MHAVVFHNNSDVGQALVRRLHEEGHKVEWRSAFDPDEFAFDPDEQLVVILDAVSIGAAVPWALQRLRERSDKALLVVLGSEDRADDRIRAFQSGADEYLAQSIVPDELAARLKAWAGRSGGRSHGKLLVNDVELDPVRRAAISGGKLVSLTPREYLVLGLLMASPGRLITRAQLERQLYGVTREVGSNRVEVHIHNLRRKLGEHFIRNVRRRGYRVGNG